MARPRKIQDGQKLNLYLSMETKRKAWRLASQAQVSISALIAGLIEKEREETVKVAESKP